MNKPPKIEDDPAAAVCTMTPMQKTITAGAKIKINREEYGMMRKKTLPRTIVYFLDNLSAKYPVRLSSIEG